ncbi:MULTISPECIES: DUF2628 domain-containing protein [unclassified Variovorax]|uniref:DUF2628 domain-containing protein n=1 Tax=unclassified Variovorax TaxID=663243 RepID=UPI001318120D|nr:MULTISPECIES: DUF2628 domain-containing protein [unclassified Variovorax]VTU43021.1 Pilin [Variovorax sp. SRS16]VTU43052.1 Pilin [Variovorax sp. PBL-E5]VTU43510.1 Pilin [Variovorax sp. PBL-H6]
MNCTDCGTLNPGYANFCAGCGKPVPATTRGPQERSLDFGKAAEAPAAPSAQARDNDAELYGLAIGHKNRDYYLRRFEAFDRAGTTSVGWHWPAFFCTFWWLLYRKMWGKAALYFFLPYLLAIALGGLAAVSPTAGGLGYVVYLLGIFIVPPLISNGGYYRHCQRLVAKARATSSNPQAQVVLVASKGGTSNIALILAVVMGVVAGIGILAAIALPAYQDYTTRAKATSALMYGKTVAAEVGSFYEAQGRLPGSLAEVLSDTRPPYGLKDVQLNTSNGVLQFVLASGPANGRTFQLIPSADAAGRVTWVCKPVDMRPSLLPSECRR